MRSAFRPTYGGPELLQIIDVADPTPRPGELLVRVAAATVNRTDCGGLWGAPYIYRFFAGWPWPRHIATGCDFAGTVVAVGEGVKSFVVGDRVMGFDDHIVGSHAELVCVPSEGNVIAIPPGIDFDDAAASLEGVHYARNFLNKVKLAPDARVLVYGATGAIGSAALAVLIDLGIEVVAVCGTAHVDLVANMGGERGPIRVVDYQRASFVDQLHGERFDLVFDAVGKSSFGACRPLLTRRGDYISSELGPGGQNIPLSLLTPWLPGPSVRFPLPTDIPKSLALSARLLAAGTLRPLMDRRVPLDDLAEAFRYVASGQKLGNVVLRCQEGRVGAEAVSDVTGERSV